MPTTVTASAKSVSRAFSGMETREQYAVLLATGLDDVLREDLKRPTEGGQWYRPYSMNKATVTIQKTYGMGPARQNRDADELPVDQGGVGFSQTFSTNTFRNAVVIERNLIEDELYGEIKRRQSDLVESMRLAKELVFADGLNRALGTSGAPFICEDGMYLLDDSRPRAYDKTGTWSNLEAASAITPTSIYTAQLNFAAHKDTRGQKTPLMLKKLIIRPQDEKTVWEILQSDLRPTDANNAKNFQKGRFEYTVYNFLDSALVFYLADDPKSQKNELLFLNRVSPQVEEVETGNPDVMSHRIRARFGIGCGLPTIWRGGTVS